MRTVFLNLLGAVEFVEQLLRKAFAHPVTTMTRFHRLPVLDRAVWPFNPRMSIRGIGTKWLSNNAMKDLDLLINHGLLARPSETFSARTTLFFYKGSKPCALF